jgi:hypothetical protein
MVANTVHFAFSAFAFSYDKSLRCGFDRHGLWFSADLPETGYGYGLLNASCAPARRFFLARGAG